MQTFTAFLDHVLKNFAVAYPYGLSKTEVTRLTFLAWCQHEATMFEGTTSPPKEDPGSISGPPKREPMQAAV